MKNLIKCFFCVIFCLLLIGCGHPEQEVPDNQPEVLDNQAEFNAKPELEIYADDVKCSHGSSSGSIDEDSIHYIMTRGIEFDVAKKLLIKGFLNEIFENIEEKKIKLFLEKSMEEQINGI